MKNRIFITGTSSDVGKTYVSALIVKNLRRQGINAGYFKPVVSGGYGDCQYVSHFAGLDVKPWELTAYCFSTSVSPHLSAKMEGKRVEETLILSKFEGLQKKYDFLVIEGCGGIICPIRADDSGFFMQTDMIKLLDTKIILVANSGLGAINSTLISLHYGKSYGVDILGVILNKFDTDNIVCRDNEKVIAQLTDTPILSKVEKNDTEIDIFQGVVV